MHKVEHFNLVTSIKLIQGGGGGGGGVVVKALNRIFSSSDNIDNKVKKSSENQFI